MSLERCENGHQIGFRRDENLGGGWYTLRCLQCEGQPLISIKCPYCGNKSVRYWLNDSKRHLMKLRCPKCNNWITTSDYHKGKFSEVNRMLPLLVVLSVLMGGILFLLSNLGLSEQNEKWIFLASLPLIFVIVLVRMRRQ